jgi:hypothetical protein
MDGDMPDLFAGEFEAEKLMGTGFDARQHQVEPDLKLIFPVQHAPLTFPGGHVLRFNLNDGLEHGTAGIREDARILADPAVLQQASITLQEFNGGLDLPFVGPVRHQHSNSGGSNCWSRKVVNSAMLPAVNSFTRVYISPEMSVST